jgi:hypothetical protein
MIRKHFRKRLALGLAFAAVVAAVVAPTAQGKVYLPGAVVQSHQQISVQPTITPPGVTAAGAALANQKHNAYPVPVSSTEVTSSTGFNWGDAGIGALVTFGALLLLLTTVLLGRRQRSRGLASV